MKRKIFSTLALVVLMFVVTIPANANENVGETSNLERMEEKIDNTVVITDKKTNKKFVQKAKNLIDNKTAKFNIEINKIQFSETKLIKYSDGDITYYMVSMPVKLQDSHELSNASIIFKKDGSFVSTTEFYLTKNQNGNFRIAEYTDGNETAMKDTEYKFETAEEFRANQQLILTKGFNINKLASCLGISSALAGAIASVCAVACAVTAGAGCIACLGLAAGFNIGGSAACIKSAWK